MQTHTNTRHRCSSRTGTLTPSGGNVRQVLWVIVKVQNQSVVLTRSMELLACGLLRCLQSLFTVPISWKARAGPCFRLLASKHLASAFPSPWTNWSFLTQTSCVGFGRARSHLGQLEAKAQASASLGPRLTCYLPVCRTQALLAMKSCYPRLVYSLKGECSTP